MKKTFNSVRKSKLAKLILILAGALALNTGRADDLESRIANLENQLVDVRLSSFQNKLRWSGEMSNSYHSLTVEDVSSDPADRTTNLLYHRTRLNVDAEIGPRLSTHVGATASFFANSSILMPTGVVDSATVENPGSYLRMEKGFFNYQVRNNLLSVSAGRLPTQFGPPYHLILGTERLGTYPFDFYSLPFDGIALTVLPVKNSDHELTFRALYTPFNIIGSSQEPAMGQSAGNESAAKGKLTSTGNFFVLMMEYQTQKMPIAESFSFITQVGKASVGRMNSFETRGLASSNSLIDRNVYEISQNSSNMLDISIATAYVEFNQLAHSGFSGFASFKYTSMEKRGDFVATIVEDHMSSALGAKGASSNIGAFITGDQSRTALAQRYGLLWSNTSKRFTFGLEYLKQPMGSIPSAMNTYFPDIMYTSIGKSQHVFVNYYIVPRIFNIILGIKHVESSDRFSSIKYIQDDRTINAVYLASLVRF